MSKNISAYLHVAIIEFHTEQSTYSYFLVRNVRNITFHKYTDNRLAFSSEFYTKVCFPDFYMHMDLIAHLPGLPLP